MNTTVFSEQFLANDFRVWLQSEFSKRCQKNPRYSLRAFAKLLDIEASSLSQILSGKRSFSRSTAEKFCSRLGTNPIEKEALLKVLEEKYNSQKRVFSSFSKINPPDFKQLSVDTFSVMSDWYHYAILELITTSDFNYDPKWIAKALNIHSTEATLAIQRLLRLGIVREENGTLVKEQAFMTNGDAKTTGEAHKELQRQLLLKALSAIDNVPQEEKDITSITMAIDVEKFPEAKKLIKDFRRKICKFMETGTRTQVYNLSIQLCPASLPVSNNRNKNEGVA